MAKLSEAYQPVLCVRCQGNGEIVTDWERYLHPLPSDVGDEAVSACPDCDGTGKNSAGRLAIQDGEGRT